MEPFITKKQLFGNDYFAKHAGVYGTVVIECADRAKRKAVAGARRNVAAIRATALTIGFINGVRNVIFIRPGYFRTFLDGNRRRRKCKVLDGHAIHVHRRRRRG